MVPVKALLVVALLALLAPAALAAPGASVTWDTTVKSDGQPARSTGEVGWTRVAARAETPAGWQAADVQTSCVPDLEADCDTVIDCEPGTLNCYASRHHRPPFPCRWVPPANGSAGHMVCNVNQTGPSPDPNPGPGLPAAECGDLLSPAACQAVPRAGDSPDQGCRRALAAATCDALLLVPQPGAACREVFAPRVCQAGRQ